MQLLNQNSSLNRFLGLIAISFGFSFLVSCTHMPDPMLQVRPGMDKAEVIQLLGEPTDRNFGPDEEYWTFRNRHYYSNTGSVKIITFKNNKVISLKNDEVAEQRNHEIERAKAGATNINIGTRGSSASRRFRCRHSNVFGKYPDGGGCNVFGCWPPGGECTTFGCSLSSRCGATSCPDRINSLPCE